MNEKNKTKSLELHADDNQKMLWNMAYLRKCHFPPGKKQLVGINPMVYVTYETYELLRNDIYFSCGEIRKVFSMPVFQG